MRTVVRPLSRLFGCAFITIASCGVLGQYEEAPGGGSTNSHAGVAGTRSGSAGTAGAGASNSGGSAGSGRDGACVASSIALLVMQDRSGSMVSGSPTGSPNSWPDSVAGLNAFVIDPASQGLDIGLGFFPQIGGTAGNCLGCNQLAVPIGPIAQTGPLINSVMSASTTTPTNEFTPLQCGLQGMIDACLAYIQQHTEGCVAVFVTDGNTSDPTPQGATCDTNLADLLKIVSDGYAKGVKTFALGLVTGALSFVNQVAQAGGTNSAFDTQGSTQGFVAALDAIRANVTVQTTVPCQ